MKTTKKITILILLILLIITACNKTNKDSDSDYIGVVEDEKKEDEKKEANNNKLDEKQIMEEFFNMINSDTNAKDIGDYINNNIQDVNQEDAEEMLKWLIVYQTEIIDDFNNKIYEPGYLEALNYDMDGVLDRKKLGNIKDDQIRNDYEELLDSFVTIVKNKEHPAVETNWKELSEFSSYISEDCNEMIKLYEKMQHYKYDRDELDILGISEDIIKTESILKKEQSKFRREKLNRLYSIQIYALLVGPEGTYLHIWTDKNSEDYRDIIKLKEIYPESILAEIISETDKAENENMDVISVLNKKLQFGLKSNKYIEEVFFEKDKDEYNIIEIIIPDDKEKQNSINNIIKNDIEEYLKDHNRDENFNLNIFHSFEDEKYISYEGVLTYEDFQGNHMSSLSFYRTLDYINEEFITLEDYLNTDFNIIKADLQRITGKEIDSMPDFLLSYNGIDLFFKEKNHMDSYLNLTKKDLAPYFIKTNK